MLREVSANLAVIQTLPQTAKRKIQVGKYCSISLLNDQSVQKAKAARERIKVRLITGLFCDSSRDRQGSGNAFEVNSSRVSRRVRLMVVDKGPALILLITEEPIADLKHHIGKMLLTRDLPPLAESLHQPCDLAKVALITKAMSVILKAPAQSFFVNC